MCNCKFLADFPLFEQFNQSISKGKCKLLSAKHNLLSDFPQFMGNIITCMFAISTENQWIENQTMQNLFKCQAFKLKTEVLISIIIHIIKNSGTTISFQAQFCAVNEFPGNMLESNRHKLLKNKTINSNLYKEKIFD